MIDLVAHLHRQHEWSERTFGPGHRTAGVLDHIRKELKEIKESPLDLSEWIDVAILAFDGAWRAGYSPEEIAAALVAKQAKNEARTWPDWRTMPMDKAIEHERAIADNWLPIESAPKDGTVILVQHPDGVGRALYLSRKDIWVSPDGADAFDATRWMPLSDIERTSAPPVE